MLEVRFHFSRHLLILLIGYFTLLKRDQLVVEVDCSFDLDEGELLFGALRRLTAVLSLNVMAILGLLAALDRLATKAVGDVGHDDKDEEEAEGEVGFPWLDDAVEEDDVKPDVGNDRPGGSNSEDTSVRNFLDSLDLTLRKKFHLLSAVVVSFRHSIDRYSRDDQEVEGGRADDSRRAKLTWLFSQSSDSLDNVEKNFGGA